jgi:hypothetical protein
MEEIGKRDVEAKAVDVGAVAVDVGVVAVDVVEGQEEVDGAAVDAEAVVTAVEAAKKPSSLTCKMVCKF